MSCDCLVKFGLYMIHTIPPRTTELYNNIDNNNNTYVRTVQINFGQTNTNNWDLLPYNNNAYYN